MCVCWERGSVGKCMCVGRGGGREGGAEEKDNGL